MNYIVFDLEWNQCPDGKESGDPDLPFEIVEIGAVKLSVEGEILGTFHQYVRPQVYKRLHYRTREVIGLSAKDLKMGLPFPDAARDFLQFCQSTGSSGETDADFSPYLFFAWGPMDVMEFQRNLAYYGMERLVPPPVYYGDVQKLFAISFEERKLRRSLEYAVDFLKLSHEGDFHAALSDAMYTARILQQVNSSVIRSNYTIDTYQYPRTKEEQIRIRYRTYEKFISRAFPDKDALLRDGEVSSVRCFTCNKEIRRKIPWTSPNHRNYEAVGLCAEHGYTKSKIRVKKTPEETCFAIKTSRPLTEEEFEEFSEKYRGVIQLARAAKAHPKKRRRRAKHSGQRSDGFRENSSSDQTAD